MKFHKDMLLPYAVTDSAVILSGARSAQSKDLRTE